MISSRRRYHEYPRRSHQAFRTLGTPRLFILRIQRSLQESWVLALQISCKEKLRFVAPEFLCAFELILGSSWRSSLSRMPR